MNNEQFIQAVLPLKDKLFRFALSILNHEADAVDIVQDTMIKAWSKLSEGHDIRNIEAWCMTITRNLSINSINKRKYQVMGLQNEMERPARQADPLKDAEMNDTMHWLDRIIDDLPTQQREVLHLRDVEGYSYKEIADILSLEVNNVKVLLHRGRKTVKMKLSQLNAHGISNAQ